mgnify:CR=1 FL=1
MANALSAELAARTDKLRSRGISPCLAVVRLGDDAGGIAYERSVIRFCAKVGAEVKSIVYPTDCTEARLIRRLKRISRDDSIHGCLLLRPRPAHMNAFNVYDALCPEKDLDCLTDGSLGSVFAGKGAGFPPCTAQACMEILDHYGYELEGKNAVIIGRSLVVGRPVAMMLQQRDATVTICHKKTRDLADICRRADIIVSATGHADTVTRDFVHAGQVVIDVGINSKSGAIVGDVAFDEVEPTVAAITPVPGGIGAVTTATLIKHLVQSAESFAATETPDKHR